MKGRRLLSSLLLLALFLSLFSGMFSASAAQLEEDKRPVRGRESYTHYTDEQLMEMLHVSKSGLNTLKNRLRDAIRNNTSCSVASLKIPYDDEAKTAIRGLIYYNPEHFMVKTLSYATTKSGSTKIFSRISFKYEEGYETGMRKLQELEAAAEEILCPIRAAGLSQLEQALLVHDFLAVNSEYDRNAVSGEDRYTAYGSIVNGMSVCQGYTEGYAYLMGKLGIPNNLCKSDSLNHAWNIIELDGKAYNVDVTWDDPTFDHAGYTRHVNFLRSTEGMIDEGHHADDFTSTTNVTDYDKAFWQKSTAKFCLLGDTIYYISGGKICSWKNGVQKELYKLPTSWSPYVNRFDYLACDGENLFFSAPDAIYRFDPATKKAAVFYKPDLSEHKNFKIYGFAIKENKFYLDVYSTPNFKENTREEYQIVYTYRKDKASAHSFDAGKVLEAATCTEDGEALFTCKGCGFTKTDIIAAKGHKVVTDKSVAATCTVDGLTKGEHCSVCNTVLTKQEVIPATGHNYVNNICKSCGDQPSAATTASSFTMGASGKYVLAAKIGTKYYAISNSLPTTSTKLKGVEIPVSSGRVSTSNASGYALTLTWTEEGYTIENNGTYLKYTSSTNVGSSSTPYLWDLSKGSNGSWRLSPSTAGTRGLLFRAGSYNQFGTYAASNAGADSTEYYDLEILPIGSGKACAHSRTTKETVEATCTASGSITVKCKSCGEVIDAQTIPAKGHTRVTDAAVAATCTKDGLTKGYHCSVCGKVTTAQKTVPAKGHSMTNGKCSTCGYTEAAAEPFRSGASGTFVLAAKVGSSYYAMPNSFPASNTKLRGTKLTVSNGVVSATDAQDYAVELKYSSGKYTIKADGLYLKYASSTNLTSADSSYKWTITKGTNGSWRITSATTTRALIFRAGSYKQFGAYLGTNATAGHAEYFDVEILPVEAAEAGCKHTNTSVSKRSASCKTDGSDTVTCQDCGEVVSSTTVPALGHDFSTVDMRGPAAAPTCTSDGYQTYCCSRCAETTATVIASTGHTEVIDEAVAPTCTSKGLTQGTHCADCNEILVAQESIPMVAHSYVGGECTICGETDETVGPFTAGQSGSFVIAAKVNGSYYAMSNTFPTAAGKLAGTVVTAKNGSITAANAQGYVLTLTSVDGGYTISSNGVYLKYASGTGVAASSEAYVWSLSQGSNGSWRLTAADKTRALLFRAGSYNTFGGYAVSNMNTNTTEYFDLEILSVGIAAACLHEETSDSGRAATCTEAGSIITVCGDCGLVLRYEEIPALGHTEVIDEAVVPTCSSVGMTEGSHCSVCDAVIVAQEVIPALMHYYEDGKCAACGAAEPIVEAFEPGQCGEFVIAAKVNGEYFAMSNSFPATTGRLNGTLVQAKNGSISTNAAQGFTVTLTYHEEGYTIESNGRFLTHSSGTALGTAAQECYWTISEGANGSWRLTPADTTRVLSFRAGEYDTFGAYAISNVTAGSGEFFDLEILSIGVPAKCLHEAPSDSVREATCTETGSVITVCGDCGLILKVQETPALGHTEVVDEAVAPTCTQTGLTEGKHCSVCDAVVQAQSVVPMLDHSYENGSCSLCGAAEPSVVPFAIGQSGRFVLAAKVDGVYYSFSNSLPNTAGKLTAIPVTVVNGAVDGKTAADCAVTLSYADGIYTIESNGSYLKYTSSTNLGTDTDAYNWVITQGTKGSWRITAEGTTRGLIYRGGEYNVFGGYATSNVTASGAEFFDIEILPVNETAPTLDASIRISHSLDLASDISVNYVVAASALAEYDSFYLECVMPEYNGNTLVKNHTVVLQPVLKGSLYYFTLTGQMAVQMQDVLEARLYMEKDGESYMSNADSYSIAQYAYSQLDKSNTSSKLKTLCAELLRYGAAAQVYKNYRTDCLADAGMTDTHKSFLSDLEGVSFGNNNLTLEDLAEPSVLWLGKTLLLDSRVTLKYVVNLSEFKGNMEDLSLHISYTNFAGEAKTAVVTGLTAYPGGENLYSFAFDGLLAAELRCVVDAAVYEGETQVSQTLRYSPDTYGNNKTGTLGTLCKALVAYSDAALAFFR